ncbi:hypothetical protein ACNOYE_07045 [Nannocystaceae bacterium ST9]
MTPTAIEYLATLERFSAVSTRKVETILQAAGRCFDVWLSFHEQFAGYVERIGHDVAVWGIVHQQPRWLAPLTPDMETEKCGAEFYVTCADVHPSYNYKLNDIGEFLGFPARDFVVHVERSAAGWAFKAGWKTEAVRQADLRDPTFIARFGDKSANHEASDQFFRYHRDDDVLVIWKVGASSPCRGWRRTGAVRFESGHS